METMRSVRGRRLIVSAVAMVLLIATGSAQQGVVPVASAGPKGATGMCHDGTYTTAAKKWQACGGHKGVATWYADAKGTPSGTGPQTAGPQAKAPVTTAAPGGGPGLVWVNTDSKVYHCSGGTFYGKTKNGKYMSEADARAMGAKPNQGKACSK